MNDQNISTHAARLGAHVQRLRTERELSVRGLAGAAQVDATWLSRLEHGEYASPDARSLARLAAALDVPLSELLLAGGFETGRGLPGFEPYLRARYGLPDAAVEQLTDYFDFINGKYLSEKGGSDANDLDQPA